VLIHADTGVHPYLLNSRFKNFPISHASHEAMLFTYDLAKLSPKLPADASKPRPLKSRNRIRLPRASG
jgi:hypothetical protein